jgi:hypothetical protein
MRLLMQPECQSQVIEKVTEAGGFVIGVFAEFAELGEM